MGRYKVAFKFAVVICFSNLLNYQCDLTDAMVAVSRGKRDFTGKTSGTQFTTLVKKQT